MNDALYWGYMEQMQALSEVYDEGEVYDILRAVVAQRDRVNDQ